jgi:hypothetical protein
MSGRFIGMKILVSDLALEKTADRLFPDWRHRSARILKKLIKRHGGEFRMRLRPGSSVTATPSSATQRSTSRSRRGSEEPCPRTAPRRDLRQAHRPARQPVRRRGLPASFGLLGRAEKRVAMNVKIQPWEILK